MKRTQPIEEWDNPSVAEHKAKEARARGVYARSSRAREEHAAFLRGAFSDAKISVAVSRQDVRRSPAFVFGG